LTVPALPAANVGGDETSDYGDLPTMDEDDDGNNEVVAGVETREEERDADGVASTRKMAKMTTFLITPFT
jgi:hypothetical protein